MQYIFLIWQFWLQNQRKFALYKCILRSVTNRKEITRYQRVFSCSPPQIMCFECWILNESYQKKVGSQLAQNYGCRANYFSTSSLESIADTLRRGSWKLCKILNYSFFNKQLMRFVYSLFINEYSAEFWS